METKFEIGDVVRCVCDASMYHNHEAPIAAVRAGELGAVYDVDGTNGGWYPVNLTLVSRASAQREGGFIPKKGDRVRVTRGKDGRPGLFRMELGTEFVVDRIRTGSNPVADSVNGDWVELSDLEPADPAPVPPSGQVFRDIQIITDPTLQPGEVKLVNHAGEEVGRFTVPTEPTQPAPMTRAARVLAKMERDPYLSGHGDEAVRVMTDGHRPNEAARLRMAKISLDRPLEADMRKWERLTCEVHPVTNRPVSGRR